MSRNFKNKASCHHYQAIFHNQQIFCYLRPIHVVTFTLISNLATDYIQKRRGEPGKIDIKVKVTTWIGQ